MGSQASHGRSRGEHPRFTTNAELNGLERLRAPWFFEAEVQRRMRTAGVSLRSARLRRLRIVAVCAVVTAGAAYAVIEYGHRLVELFPEPAPPAAGPSTLETQADTSTALPPQPERETARPAPAAIPQRVPQRAPEISAPGQESEPSTATDTISGAVLDSVPRSIPAAVSDTTRNVIPPSREDQSADTLLRRESRPAPRPVDSSSVRPDTLRGTP